MLVISGKNISTSTFQQKTKVIVYTFWHLPTFKYCWCNLQKYVVLRWSYIILVLENQFANFTDFIVLKGFLLQTKCKQFAWWNIFLLHFSSSGFHCQEESWISWQFLRWRQKFFTIQQKLARDWFILLIFVLDKYFFLSALSLLLDNASNFVLTWSRTWSKFGSLSKRLFLHSLKIWKSSMLVI